MVANHRKNEQNPSREHQTKINSMVNSQNSLQVRNIRLFHNRMGHSNGHVVSQMIAEGNTMELNIGTANQELINALCGPACDTCMVSKMRRSHVSTKSGEDPRQGRHLGHFIIDPTGPYPAAIDGSRYLMMYRDRTSGWLIAHKMTTRSSAAATLTKSDEECRGLLRRAGYVLQPHESAITIIQSDNAKELTGGAFKSLCLEKQISQCTSTPYRHENMALVERIHGVIFNMVRSFLSHSGEPTQLWADAAMLGVYIRNRIPSKGNPSGQSSFKILMGHEDKSFRCKVFGCDAFVHIPPEVRGDKLQPRAMKLTYIGEDANSTSSILVDLSISPAKIYHRCDAVFREDQFTALSGAVGLKMSDQSGETTIGSIGDLLWEPSVAINENDASQLSGEYTIYTIKPYMREVDNEILTYVLLQTSNHPGGIWSFLHHLDCATIAPMLADFLLGNQGIFDHWHPMYQTYTSQVPEHPDEMEPGFLVGVDCNHDVAAPRHMLLLRVNTGVWYLADVCASTLHPIPFSECASRAADIMNKPKRDKGIAMTGRPVGQQEVILFYEKDGTPVTHPKNRRQMCAASDNEKWRISEQKELEQNMKNETMTMTSMTRRELETAGYEVISSTIAYKPRSYLDDNKETVLKDRKAGYAQEAAIS
jgi:hypothetical protein